MGLFFSSKPPEIPRRSITTTGKLAGCLIFMIFLGVAGTIGFVALFGNIASEGYRDGVVQKFSLRNRGLWKTHEGELATAGFGGSHSEKVGQSGGVAANTFSFSVLDPDVVKEMNELPPDSYVRLYYTEYRYVLPWESDTTYIVTKIVPIKK